VTHKIFLNFLESRREEDDRQGRYGGPSVGRGNTGNLLDEGGEKEE
jgi:hypothetical protein